MGRAAVDYILGARKYQVTARVVVARLDNGGERYVYRHGLLPTNTAQSQIDHLLVLGMIVPLGSVE